MPRFAAVYRHFNANGDLLYVGCSISPFMRLRAHEWGSSWAMDIVSVSIEWFPCETLALAAEKKAILEEGPRHNKMPKHCGKALRSEPPVTRGICNGRFGWPGNEKPLPPDMAVAAE